MTAERTKRAAFVSLFLACGWLLFFYRLDARDLWSSHEARAAQDAQSMIDSGDWLLPRLFDGQPELQKPPLYYWLVAGIAWLRGGNVDALAERLPAALAALATACLVACVLLRNGRPRAGLLAGVILATAQHFTWISRTGRIDVPLTFTVAAAVLGIQSHLKKWQCCGYIAMACGVMFKGPIGLVLPASVLVADRRLRTRNEDGKSSWWWGVPLVAAITVPWFVAVHLRTDGEFTRVFFWHHYFDRATGGSETLASHPWWMYLARWAVDPLPWSPLLVAAIAAAVRTSWLRDDRWARLGVIWLGAITLVLSLSRFKRADYLLPAYPGMALFLGCACERWLAFRNRLIVPAACGVLAAGAATWVGLFHTIVARMDADHRERAFAAEIRAIAPKPELVLLFRVENHLLAWHLGRPLNSFLEWENLDVWAGRRATHLIVMPAECAAAWRQYITSGMLEEVARMADPTDRQHPRDLVLVRTHARERTIVRTAQDFE